MRRLPAGGWLALAELLPQIDHEGQHHGRSQSDEKPDADAHPEVQSVLHRYPLSATDGLGVRRQPAQIKSYRITRARGQGVCSFAYLPLLAGD